MLAPVAVLKKKTLPDESWCSLQPSGSGRALVHIHHIHAWMHTNTHTHTHTPEYIHKCTHINMLDTNDIESRHQARHYRREPLSATKTKTIKRSADL